ncbi:MAG: cardiolipin synthase [Kordiimonadales bacterium]|nr:MAG: cardiolipin synthase [Kordiimonadales bacterium]
MSFDFLTWPDGLLLAALLLIAQVLVTIHVMRNKEEVRSAVSWLGVVWLVPVFGLLFYMLFGVNRIRRRARLSRQKRGLPPRSGTLVSPPGPKLTDAMPLAKNRWRAHDRLAGRVCATPLALGNNIKPLKGGRGAYDAMIAAIDAAEHTVALTTYIFQIDQAGRRFIQALTRAHERGVQVRVLVDAVGNLYGLRPVSSLLRRRGIPVAVFNPARFSWRLAFFNLRTHRKLLIIDGHRGFAGGMNIRKHHLEGADGKPRVQDMQFQLDGPIVSQMMDAFADDWAFSDGEELPEEVWMPPVAPVKAGITARSIADGPDEPRQKAAMVIESALGAARERVQIITPYFLPEQGLVSALKQAALRGVQVDILVPEKNNLPFFSTTAMAGVRQLVQAGCNLYLSKPPFDHSKLMIVDDCWVLFGSSNWDARSFKLNFEFNIETYSHDFGAEMGGLVTARYSAARKMTLEALDERPLASRIMGRIMWLASPYL